MHGVSDTESNMHNTRIRNRDRSGAGLCALTVLCQLACSHGHKLHFPNFPIG